MRTDWASLVGSTYTSPAPPCPVTVERVTAFAASTGATYQHQGPVPATFPFVVVFPAIASFLDQAGIDMARTVHSQQQLTYARSIRVGDLLSTTLTVVSVHPMRGRWFVSTHSDVVDQRRDLVCRARAMLAVDA